MNKLHINYTSIKNIATLTLTFLSKFHLFTRSSVIKDFSGLIIIKVFLQRLGSHIFVVADASSSVETRPAAYIPSGNGHKDDNQEHHNNNTSYHSCRKTTFL